MSQEKFWILFSKKLSGEATPEEIGEFETIAREHPEWQYAIQNLSDLWQQGETVSTLREEDAYLLHLHRMSELGVPFDDTPVMVPAGKRMNRKWYLVAATVFVAVAGFMLLNKGKPGGRQTALTRPNNEISTRPGSKTQVKLPDGTMVYLNSGSRLTYDERFGQDTREVTLTGEGFFEVKRMKEKPFIIHTSTINIKVLGTVFNVKAYPEDKKTETSLIHGSIEVTIRNRPNDKIILSPSEKLVVDNNSVALPGAVRKEKQADIPESTLSVNKLKYNEADSTVAETAWKDNRLVFNDESLEELAVRMERWYNVEISITEPALRGKRLTGNFENESIEQALEALKISFPFQYTQTGKKIIIHR